jgi:hypothetical protein
MMLRLKKLEILKNAKTVKEPIKTKQSAMKLSQIRRRIELCMREIILRFKMDLQNLIFSLQFNPNSYSKASTEVLSYWAAETLGDQHSKGDQQSTSRGLNPGVNM